MRSVFVTCNLAAQCAAVFLLSVCAAHASVADHLPTSPYEATVTAPGAPVLSGPGAAFYAVDTLAEGEVVEVHREQPGGWLGIRPPDDSFSWLFGRHVKLLDGGLAKIEKDDVASRIGSRTRDDRNAVQVRLKKGEIVEILGEQTIDGQTWYKIAPPAGEFRWIHSRYVVRSDADGAQSAAAPPVVTVPIADNSDIEDTPPVTLVADSQPVQDDIWRAAPPAATSIVATGGETSTITAPPLTAEPSAAANQALTPQSEDKTAGISGVAAPVAPATNVEGASAPLATLGPAHHSNVTTPPLHATGPVSDGLARQLTALEMHLSRIVVEPPATWQIEPLASEAQRLLGQSQSVSDRAAVQITLAKIDRFAAIGRRYRQISPASAESGDPRTTLSAGSGDLRTAAAMGYQRTVAAPQPGGAAPITPLPSTATDLVGPDGQRYDAIGILRPVVSKRAGAPQFALLNDRGQVVSFVTPTPDVNLQPYVGHRIGVTGSRGYIPEFQRAHVTAGRVAPLSERLIR